jgi:hypothetical protein
LQKPPHIDAAPARLIEADGPVYALVGAVLDRTKVSEADPVHILVAPDSVREYGADFLPVFEFFRVPREEWQVREWLSWAGGDDDFLRALLDTRSVVRVETRDPLTASESLRGLRLAPQCSPFEVSPNAPGFIYVRRDEAEDSYLPITFELGEALWGEQKPTDVPTVIERVERKFKLPRDMAARRVISDIPLLLLHGYARLEWLNVPRP